MIGRRGFLTGVFSAFAAPAIVRFDSLMPVKALPLPLFPVNATLLDEYLKGMSQRVMTTIIYGNEYSAPINFSGMVAMVNGFAHLTINP